MIELNKITTPLIGKLEVPGDKSISHRAVMIGSMAKGITEIKNFLDAEDCMQTAKAFESLGVKIEKHKQTLRIKSDGYKAFKEPTVPLYFGNSGTTARLMLGLLAGIPIFSSIYGDPFLTERPMDRVVNPLKKMGMIVDGRENGTTLPICIRGTKLTGVEYSLPVKSAQVKSAILLAGLLAEGKTIVNEDIQTRNHTENMLEAFGADININNNKISITNKNELIATHVEVPGDISSAAFLLIAAAIVPNSKITIVDVGLNETRTGIIDVLKEMGANIQIDNIHNENKELIGNVTITYKKLHGIIIQGEIIPRLIDEIPVIALLATQATGRTIIKNAEELRVKETDRIDAVVDVLSTLGADITPTADGMIIKGKTTLYGAQVSAYNDHRMAMMIVVASLIAEEKVVLDDATSINVSYPNFFDDLNKITAI